MPAFILAGGRSRRLGEDKARALLYPGLTLIEAVQASFEDIPFQWTVVADEAEKFTPLGLETIVDDTYQGPLGGVLRAARDVKSRTANEGYFFVTSCDRVGIQSQWVARLQQELVHAPPAVAFRARGRWEPLFAFYHTRLMTEFTRRLRSSDRSLWRALDAVGAKAVAAPSGWEDCFSVNTPEDLARARHRASRRSARRPDDRDRVEDPEKKDRES